MSRLLVALCCVTLLVVTSSSVSGSRVESRLKSRLTLQPQSPNPAQADNPFDAYPHMSMLEFHDTGRLPGDDALSQIRSMIGPDEELALRNAEMALQESESADEVSFVETGAQVGKVRSFCEICILIMQMKQRGQPHLCAGLNTNYHLTCIESLESILRADKAIVYWLKNGCMHMDSEGPEIVRPCPAINICSWVPNLFADAPSIVRDGVESLCPKDPKFLPTIPMEFRNLLGNTDNTAADTSATDGPVNPTTRGV
mgnify:CR=1 FL=1